MKRPSRGCEGGLQTLGALRTDYVRWLVRLAFPAPKIVEAIATDHQPPELNRESSDPSGSSFRSSGTNRNARSEINSSEQARDFLPLREVGSDDAGADSGQSRTYFPYVFAFGFLPKRSMAMATNMGAEVQRPLTTVGSEDSSPRPGRGGSGLSRCSVAGFRAASQFPANHTSRSVEAPSEMLLALPGSARLICIAMKASYREAFKTTNEFARSR